MIIAQSHIIISVLFWLIKKAYWGVGHRVKSKESIMGEERGGTYLERPLKGADWQEGEILLFLGVPDEVHIHQLLQLKHTHLKFKKQPSSSWLFWVICFCLFYTFLQKHIRKETENFKKHKNKHHPIPALTNSFSTLITRSLSWNSLISLCSKVKGQRSALRIIAPSSRGDERSLAIRESRRRIPSSSPRRLPAKWKNITHFIKRDIIHLPLWLITFTYSGLLIRDWSSRAHVN